MKNASKKMYGIGNIINSVYLGIAILCLVIGLIMIIVGAANDDPSLVSSGGSCFGFGCYLLAGVILCFVFVKKAQREVSYEGNASQAPLIISIVFGAISNNPLYVLAGIFGLIAQSQARNNPSEPKEVEEKKEQE